MGCLSIPILVITSVFIVFIVYRITQPSVDERISFELTDNLKHFRKINTYPFERNEVLPAFVNYNEVYVVAPKYNLATCQIYKSMSTVRTGIFCLLYDTDGFLKYNSSSADPTWQNTYCRSNSYSSISGVDSALSPNYTNFVVIREPIDRFLSGFVHLCVNRKFCYGCGENLRCLLEKQYARFQRQLLSVPKKRDVLFLDVHFAPQTWFCAFHSRFSDYEFVRYGNGKEKERMTADVMGILERKRVEDNLLAIIRKEFNKGKTYHSTAGSVARHRLERELLEDSHALSLMVKMYFFDFVVFDYEFPTF